MSFSWIKRNTPRSIWHILNAARADIAFLSEE